MNQNSNDRIVSLRDLWTILRQRLIVLAAVAVLVSLGGYLAARLTYEPV